MDLLIKGELQRKRKAAADDFAGKCFVGRSELEQKRLQTLLAKAREPACSSAATVPRVPGAMAGNPNPSSAAAASGPSEPGAAVGDWRPSSSAASASSITPALDLPRDEVVRRLRLLRQPVTLFGEDDDARVEHFRLVLKYGLVNNIDYLDMTDGKTSELRKRRKVAAGRYTNAKGRRVGGGSGGISADEEDEDGDDDDTNRMNANFEDLCDEDRILVFFKKLLNEWKQELDAMSELEKGTAHGKFVVATFNQRARDLDPLFNLCRKKVVPYDIREALLDIIECCMKHNYLAASEQYIKLAIGNALLPIGVTMTGIHERSARETIHTKSVAHIMNDATTRRYLQSINKLMTRCRPHYPAQP